MTTDDLILRINDVGFDSLVSQAAIQTEADKQEYQTKGYMIELTEAEFKAKFDLDPKKIWYTPAYGSGCLYFNEDTLAVCIVYLELLIDHEYSETNQSGQSSNPYNIERVKNTIERVEQEAQDNHYNIPLMCLPDAMRMEYFNKLVSKKGTSIPNLYDLFITYYTDSDYGFKGIEQETLDFIFNSKTPNEKRKTTMRLKHHLAHQANHERPNLRDVSDTITVYRGGNSASTSYNQAYSWSLNINVANFFAIRRGKGPASIIQGEVYRKDVIEYIDIRGEQEIIVNPSSVRNIKTIQLKDNNFLKAEVHKVGSLFTQYLDKLKELDYHHPNSIHGPEHSARVLLLSLIIADTLNLSSSDKRILAEAAIYHDTRRTHDGVCPIHGKSASIYYHNNTSKPDPLVEFLCEYHCRPDEEGYTEIKQNRKLSKHREKTILLYQIFKDADGLDRIRLNDIKTEMDLAQYRLPVTKELTFVAKLLYSDWRIME